MKLQNVTLSTNEKMGFISNLTTMLEAGIPILEVVDSLLDGSKGGQKIILETLRADLMQGQRVNQTFSKFPKVFDKVTTNIIKASEEAGTLDVTLKDLKTKVKKDAEFNAQIRSALMYPIFILFVFFGVFTMILTVVVPKISTVFLNLNVPLPLPTKIMMYLSDQLLHHTLPVLIGVGIIVGFFVYLLKKQQRFLLSVLFLVPVISNLARLIDIVRFTRSLYLLLSSGLPITNALELSQEVVVKKEVSQVISKCRDVVSQGRRLSEGFEGSKVIPLIVTKIVQAGEKSGSLDKSFLDASEYMDYEVSGTLKAVTALLEPVMLVVVGVMIGGMMLAIIAPIYSLIGSVGGQ